MDKDRENNLFNKLSHGDAVAQIASEQHKPDEFFVKNVDNKQGRVSTSKYLSALEEVARYMGNHPEHKVVVNLSLGSRKGVAREAELIRSLLDRGAILVAAAGNDGSEGVSFPAAFDGVIAVAAATRHGKLKYSSYGPEIDIATPGYFGEFRMKEDSRKILVASIHLEGTSFSAPRVTSTIIKLLALSRRRVAPIDLAAILKATATPIDDELYHDQKLGAGLLNVHAAVKSVSPSYWSSWLLCSVILSCCFGIYRSVQDSSHSMLMWCGVLFGIVASAGAWLIVVLLFTWTPVAVDEWLSEPPVGLVVPLPFAIVLFFASRNLGRQWTANAIVAQIRLLTETPQDSKFLKHRTTRLLTRELTREQPGLTTDPIAHKLYVAAQQGLAQTLQHELDTQTLAQLLPLADRFHSNRAVVQGICHVAQNPLINDQVKKLALTVLGKCYSLYGQIIGPCLESITQKDSDALHVELLSLARGGLQDKAVTGEALDALLKCLILIATRRDRPVANKVTALRILGDNLLAHRDVVVLPLQDIALRETAHEPLTELLKISAKILETKSAAEFEMLECACTIAVRRDVEEDTINHAVEVLAQNLDQHCSFVISRISEHDHPGRDLVAEVLQAACVGTSAQKIIRLVLDIEPNTSITQAAKQGAFQILSESANPQLRKSLQLWKNSPAQTPTRLLECLINTAREFPQDSRTLVECVTTIVSHPQASDLLRENAFPILAEHLTDQRALVLPCLATIAKLGSGESLLGQILKVATHSPAPDLMECVAAIEGRIDVSYALRTEATKFFLQLGQEESREDLLIKLFEIASRRIANPDLAQCIEIIFRREDVSEDIKNKAFAVLSRMFLIRRFS